MSNKIPRWKLIEDLQIGEIALGHPPTCDEYKEFGNYTHNTILNRFGTWESALEAAGMDLDEKPTGNVKVEKDAVIRDLQRLSVEIEGVPSNKDYADHGEYSLSVVYKRFGGITNALVEAGLIEEHSE